MSKYIVFVTGNDRKLSEARQACDLFDVEIVQKNVDIDEIQSIDPQKISELKALMAYKKIKEPLVVTDTFWTIPALGGFPGAYMKEVASWFEEYDFLRLMANKDDRRIMFSENITYTDGDHIKHFSKEYTGMIVDTPRGSGNSIENVAEFEGYTLGERREQGGYSHKPEDYVWYDFAKWYSGSE